jgi:hypothetical protein
MISIFVLVGSTVASYIPVLWGASELSAVSLLFGLFGGIAGVFVGVRVLDY